MASNYEYHVCVGCNNTIEGECFNCIKCKQIFDSVCANLASKTSINLSAEYLRDWICAKCSNETSRVCDLSPSESVEFGNITLRAKPKQTQVFSPVVNVDLPAPTSFRTIIQHEIQTMFKEQLNPLVQTTISEQFAILANDNLYIKMQELMLNLIDLVNRNAILEEKLRQYEEVGRAQCESAEPIVAGSRVAVASPRSNTKNLESNSINIVAQTQSVSMTKKKLPSTSLTVSATSTSETSRVVNQNILATQLSGAPHAPVGEPSTSMASSNSPFPNNESKDNWKQVKYRRGRTVPTGVLRGTAKPGTTLLEASERRQYIHLYYVRQGTSSDQVRDHLTSICNSDVCTVEMLKSRGDYASFKLGVPSKMAGLILDTQNWAEDICVKPWRQNFRRQNENKTQ